MKIYIKDDWDMIASYFFMFLTLIFSFWGFSTCTCAGCIFVLYLVGISFLFTVISLVILSVRNANMRSSYRRWSMVPVLASLIYVITYILFSTDHAAAGNYAAFDCKAHKDLFSDYSWFFEDKDYLGWCEDCKSRDGIPQVSHDAGPFCNLRADDAGKYCTDSSQCKGYCLADSSSAASGTCSGYRELEDGCWSVLENSKAGEVCVS